MLLTGIFPAITTPFYPDGKLYLRKLEHNVDRYSKTPIAGIVVLGSTGEAVALTTEEQKEVLKVARENCAAEKVLIAGVGQESAEATLDMIDAAAKLDYDVALVRTPYYYRPQIKAKPESQLAYFRFVADRSSLPVLLYSVPPFTAYDLPVEYVADLSAHKNIIGIKESSGVVEKIAQMKQATSAAAPREVPVTATFEAFTKRMAQKVEESNGNFVSAQALGGTAVAAPPKVKTRTKAVGFQIAAGAAQQLLPSLNAGASAAVLAFASAAPTACFEIFAAWKDGNQKLADEKQQRIVAAAQKVSAGFGVPGTKYAMDLNGYYGGGCRLPLLPLTQAEKDEIAGLMRDLKN